MKYDLRPHVRMIMCGAAPLSHELNEQLFKMFPTAHIGQAYGTSLSSSHLFQIRICCRYDRNVHCSHHLADYKKEGRLRKYVQTHFS